MDRFESKNAIKRVCLVRVFAGFCVFDCSMDFMSYFRGLTLENPQIHRTILPHLDSCESKNYVNLLCNLYLMGGLLRTFTYGKICDNKKRVCFVIAYISKKY